MPKEKSVNPAQAQRKAEKAKAIKKSKAEQQSRRNEKLARRNPDRLQKQLDELKAIETSGGKLTSHEKSVLEGLEKDIKAVKRAREALGDTAPKFSSGHGDKGDRDDRGGRGAFFGGSGRGGGVLGKRRRDDEGGSSEEEEVPEDVKVIPMPRDTPPPIPKEILDRWYQKRRERMGITQGARGTNANNTPLGDNARLGDRSQGQAVEKPPMLEAKTVYEAKPIVRDLRKEAVSFVPAAVRAKLDKSKGVGGLVEPEEADILEKAGYMGAVRKSDTDQVAASSERQPASRAVVMEEVEDEDG
ncbi:WW domain binding protein 11-domain-containing protein [Tricladium varicosporioides]|nr:WW domain binding protein 11-domain-containing protein [Hymenoscyphus varicosporioides]